jgi:hypothetical protein
MVMISIGNCASSFTPKQLCKKELVLLRCLSLVHMITLILILVWYARVHSFFNIKKSKSKFVFFYNIKNQNSLNNGRKCKIIP